MNSNQMFAIIEEIANTSSKLEKQRILNWYKDEKDFTQILNLALNPYITFGVTNVSIPLNCDDNYFTDETIRILLQLSERKLTGNNARNEITNHLENLTRASQELFIRILKKDLRAGFSSSTVNKVIPNFIPEFKCMLAAPMNEKKLKNEVFVEPKYDGVRVLAYISGKNITFYSRGGREFFNFEFLKEELRSILKDEIESFKFLILDGEVTASTFNEIVGKSHRKEEQMKNAVFNIFDVPSLTHLVLKERKTVLSNMFKDSNSKVIKLVPYLLCKKENIENAYIEFLSQGLEGAIVKNPYSLYEDKRSTSWMKLKEINSLDLVITSVFEGTGKYEGMMGGVIGVDQEGRLKVSVGTGFSDEQRLAFWDERISLIGRWIEIAYQNETVNDSVRHPRFIRFRDTFGEKGIKE
jgi:DNA ligase-1